ncbi:MAG: hypothetical protein V4528_06580 [Pseudomonadota bacterium]
MNPENAGLGCRAHLLPKSTIWKPGTVLWESEPKQNGNIVCTVPRFEQHQNKPHKRLETPTHESAIEDV